MSAFMEWAEEYLTLRRALGHQLAEAARLLPRFVAYLDDAGAPAITTEVALAWVRRPDAVPASTVWLRRMTVVRGFARHMSGIDPATEVPRLGLVSCRQHWRPPFIYSPAQIEAFDGRGAPPHPDAAAGSHLHHDDRAARRLRHAHW